MRPLCFVLMPFGRKPNGAGGTIDFDAVYTQLIAPTIEAANLEPIRADEETSGGIIHKPMFERLILCEYAVADLTTANANVFYELGVRHAVRPWTTVLIFAKGGRLPFDVTPLRALPYPFNSEGLPTELDTMQHALLEHLKAARDPQPDSPLFQLLDGFQPMDIARLKTDVFRDRVRYSVQMKQRLAAARTQGLNAVRAVEVELGQIEDCEGGTVIDLFLSYRAVKAWQSMIDLVNKMPIPLRETVIVQEQLALALNRINRGGEAEQVLLDVLAKRGPSSETYGILGRVYKDRWDAAMKTGDLLLARGLLDKAIDAYLHGFESDWRDAYPGINTVTLMEMKDPPDPRRHNLLPVVSYSVERRIAAGKPDYWDYATLLELAVLAKDEKNATHAFTQALSVIRESWEPETTSRNLGLIREARERRNQKFPWATEIEEELKRRVKSLEKAG